MSTFLRLPKVQLSILLFLIFISAFIRSSNPFSLTHLLLILALTIFFDLLFTYLRKGVFFIPFAGIASGLIISLIVDPSTPLIQIAAVSLLAMFVKNFLRIAGRHIFNPAASGLILAGIIFQQTYSWWGVTFQITPLQIYNLIFLQVLLTPLLVSGLKLGRYFSVLTFLATSSFLSQILFFNLSLQSFINSLLNPSTIFFATVMLPEPMTSPINYKRQILYGILVGTIPFIFSLSAINIFLSKFNIALDPILFSLLIGNLIFFKYR